MTWFLLAVAVMTETAATLSLRASRGLGEKKRIAPVAVLYVMAFALFAATLANGMTIGVAYGVWAACGVTFTSVGARRFFKERITRRMGAGMVFITAGVLIIGLGSRGHCRVDGGDLARRLPGNEVITYAAATACDPLQCPLHHSTSRQHHEMSQVGPFHDLHRKNGLRACPIESPV
jgi:small multidrug resistance pump